jgi:uncharacterized protein (TIGR03435 family)
MRFVLAVSIPIIAFAQAQFEVASIKPVAAPADGNIISGINTSTPGLMRAQNVTLRRCIRGAYDIPATRVLLAPNGPKWFDQDLFNIEARADGPATDPEMMKMLQSLLAERFKLEFHRETRSLSGYQLVVGKKGILAKASEPETKASTNAKRGVIDAKACSMDRLAQRLSESLQVPVANTTGIAGGFDFKLEWSPDEAQRDGGPSIFTAIQEQLGLKLESRKFPAEVLIVDRAEKPTKN